MEILFLCLAGIWLGLGYVIFGHNIMCSIEIFFGAITGVLAALGYIIYDHLKRK